MFLGIDPIVHLLWCTAGHCPKLGARIDLLLRSIVAVTLVALTLLQIQIWYSSEPPGQVAVPLLITCAVTQSVPCCGGGVDDCDGEGDGLGDFDGVGDDEGLFEGLPVDVGLGLPEGLLLGELGLGEAVELGLLVGLFVELSVGVEVLVGFGVLAGLEVIVGLGVLVGSVVSRADAWASGATVCGALAWRAAARETAPQKDLPADWPLAAWAPSAWAARDGATTGAESKNSPVPAATATLLVRTILTGTASTPRVDSEVDSASSRSAVLRAILPLRTKTFPYRALRKHLTDVYLMLVR